MSKTVLEKMQAAVDSERLRVTLGEDMDLSDVREWAEALTELADNLEQAVEAVSSWSEAEDREERADAKEEALSAISQAIESWEAVTALPDVEGLVTAP